MKPHERRAVNAYPYYKLATWNARLQCWAEGKRAYEQIGLAMADSKKPGRYRISKITDGGREDLEPFEIAAPKNGGIVHAQQ